MINWEITTELNGKDEKYFIAHPKSNKKVYVMCPICGQMRWTEFRLSSKLCQPCSLKMQAKKNIKKSKVKSLHSILVEGISINTRLNYNPNTDHMVINNSFRDQKLYYKNRKN